MSTSTTRIRRPLATRLLIGVLLTAALVGVLSLADPVAAKANIAFTASGTGTWGLHPAGNGDLAARAEQGLLSQGGKEKPPVKVAATVGTDDRTLPDHDQCEHATATFSVWREQGDRFTEIVDAIGDGTLCAFVPEGESTLRYSFVGSFEVYDGQKKLEGVDGFYELRFFAGGEAYLFATDS